jgi:hypothetical protein
MLRSFFKLTAFLATTALIAGCGGSGNDSISRAEYIKQADTICVKDREKRFGEASAYARSHASKLSKLTQPEEGEALLAEVFLPGMRKQIEDLEALEVPDADSAKIRAFFAAMQRGIAKIEAEPDVSKVAEGKTFSEANKLGGEYGFVECEL